MMAFAMRLGRAKSWLKGARRWHSALPVANLNKAMEAFYNEREALLRQNISALRKSRQKQVDGLRPRSIESTIASLSSAGIEATKATDDSQPNLDLSNLFQSPSNTLRKIHKGMDMKQQMKSMAPGAVLSTKFIPGTQEISLSVFVPPAVLAVLSQATSQWRLRMLETRARDGVKIRLQPQKDRLVSCAMLRGLEADLVHAYRSLLVMIDNMTGMLRGAVPVKEVQLLKPLPDGALHLVEVVSGTCAVFAEPNIVKLWGGPEQIFAATAYLDLVQSPRVTNLSVNYGRGIGSLPELQRQGGNAHLARATMVVPTQRLKIVVGKDAVLLRQLKALSGARIKFDPIPTASGFTFWMSGSILSVHSAVDDVTTRLDEYERYLQDTRWREHIALRDREELTRLVGHDFVNIRKIEMMSGAFLRVSPQGDPVLSVRLWGTKRNVESAVKAVYALTRLDSPSII